MYFRGIAQLSFELAKRIEKDYQKLVGTNIADSVYMHIIATPISFSEGVLLGMFERGDNLMSLYNMKPEKDELYTVWDIVQKDEWVNQLLDASKVFTDLYPDFYDKYLLT